MMLLRLPLTFNSACRPVVGICNPTWWGRCRRCRRPGLPSLYATLRYHARAAVRIFPQPRGDIFYISLTFGRYLCTDCLLEIVLLLSQETVLYSRPVMILICLFH